MNKTIEKTKDINRGKDSIQSEIYSLRDEISKAGKVLDINKRKNIEARLSRLDNLVTKELQNEGNTAQDKKELEQLKQSISTIKLNLNNAGSYNQGESYRTYMRSIQRGNTTEQSTSEIITEQVSQTISSGNLDQNPGNKTLKALGIIAAGVGIGALLYKGCKSLFGDESESEDSSEQQTEESSESEEESEENDGESVGGSSSSKTEEQGEKQGDNSQQESSNPESDESLEADQELVKRFDKYLDILLGKKCRRIEHNINGNNFFQVGTRSIKKEGTRDIHVGGALTKGNKNFLPSYYLSFNPTENRFTYSDDNNNKGKVINNKKVREVLDNIEDAINGDHSSLDKLIS